MLSADESPETNIAIFKRVEDNISGGTLSKSPVSGNGRPIIVQIDEVELTSIGNAKNSCKQARNLSAFKAGDKTVRLCCSRIRCVASCRDLLLSKAV